MTAEKLSEEIKIVFEHRSVAQLLYLSVKRALYVALKYTGFFEIARRVTSRSLRIICYHGFSLEDEHLFSPHTFIRGETFEKRMRALVKGRFRVIGLHEAVERLKSGQMLEAAIVITIDDGFHGTAEVARPILEKFGFPATIYVTTYHVSRRTPVFGLMVQYILWKSQLEFLDATSLGMGMKESLSIKTLEEKAKVARMLIDHGENRLDESNRLHLLESLAGAAGIDWKMIAQRRILGLLDEVEIRELGLAGFDIELHTHRHCFPADRDGALMEIADNRAVLEPIVSKRLVHFCYPNGRWKREHFELLLESGIESAVTCDLGLNDSRAEILALKRFGDSEALSQIEFEAEIYGLAEVMRNIQRSLARLAWRR